MSIPKNLPRLVKEKYVAAKAAGDLTFSPTELSIIHTNGVPVCTYIHESTEDASLTIQFQLRYCPSLGSKPKNDKKTAGAKTPIDPFENPDESLLIAQLPQTKPSHVLVLNKFPIIAEHFIVATKGFKEQTHLLEEDDLGVTYACLKAWREHGSELFAFFNSGEHSGASQPHRHLQLLPVESMAEGADVQDWKVLADSLAGGGTDIPFAYFAREVPQDTSDRQLHEIYKSLYDCAVKAVTAYVEETKDGNVKLHETNGGASAISYNLGLTHKSMVLCPRRSEGLGNVQLNGTLLAGTLMVKDPQKYQDLQQDESQFLAVLRAIGIPESRNNEKL